VNLARRGGSLVLRSIVHRARVQRPKARELLRRLRALEYCAPEELARRQMIRLRETVAWACWATPYWREQARQAGWDARALASPTDIAALPVLTKTLLREQGEGLRPATGPQPGWFANASGGSTGVPVRLMQDSGYLDEAQAAQWFIEGWWGIRPGDATAWLWGADRDLAQRSLRERALEFLMQERALNAFTVEEAELDAFVRMLARWQPPLIAGYASALDLCARYLLNHPEIRIRPRALRSTAEVLRAEERKRVEQAFQAPVYDQYGSREVNNLASECPAHQGLHLNVWGRFLELVDGEGRPVPPGQPGRILVTDLSNRATAMLRYENGDIGVASARSCDCGRPFPLLERIVGRKSDFIHAPGGKLIHGEFFTHLFYDHPEVRAFQVVQERIEVLRVEVEIPNARLAELAAALEPRIGAAMGSGVRIEFQQVEMIQRPESGKHRFTRSTLDLPWTS